MNKTTQPPAHTLMSNEIHNDEYDKMEYQIHNLPFDMPIAELIREWDERGKIIESLINHILAPSYIQWQRDALIEQAQDSLGR
jgi:hypothetical protein